MPVIPCCPGFLHRATLENTISTSSNDRQRPEELRGLLARLSVIRNGCDLDLLVFLYRHPRILLTNEQIATFVGYDMKQVAQSLEKFMERGLLERTQNPMHAARMYLLELSGPQNGGFKTLLELASTRLGRHEILQILNPDRPDREESTQRLRLVINACA
jgi:DNA-binding MarR family transcriptional regulator